MRGWEGMREDSEQLLRRRTGCDAATWAERSRVAGLDDEAALRGWLDEQGVHGYGQMLVVMERFGYPDYFLSTPDEMVDAQYADRPALRPVLDAVLAVATALPEVTVQARKGYVSLVARRQFAVVRPTTRTRVDLGLRLDGERPDGRLLPARGLGNDTIGLRVALTAPEDVDDEVAAWLARAREESA